MAVRTELDAITHCADNQHAEKTDSFCSSMKDLLLIGENTDYSIISRSPEKNCPDYIGFPQKQPCQKTTICCGRFVVVESRYSKVLEDSGIITTTRDLLLDFGLYHSIKLTIGPANWYTRFSSQKRVYL